ncbi:MAG: T9SS type A sorting domain-containing protein, partial [Sphingobacteriales bacterium]
YYPTITGSLVGGRTAKVVVPNADQRPVAGNFTHADNMTIVAMVSPGSEFRKSDSIVAYVNGEVRGKAKAILNPDINSDTYFFNIGGEADQSIVFMVERDGAPVAQSSTVIRYSSNTVMGTLAKPMELQFVKQANVFTVNPNPFNQSTTIRLDVTGLPNANSSAIQVTVLDVLGRKVSNLSLQKLSPTTYTATWNGKSSSGAVSSNGVYFIQAIVAGVPHVFKVLKAACLNPVIHYGMKVGQLQLNDPADFILVRDLIRFEVLQTWIDGILVAENGNSLIEAKKASAINQFDCQPKNPEDFEVVHSGAATIPVIEALDGQLITNRLDVAPNIENGKLVTDVENDILKITVVNRYREAPVATAFIKNFGLKHGAIASSVAHDSHNIVAV